MKVAIVGPIATADVAHLLGAAAVTAPRGYGGAPILGTLIESLLERGHAVVGITTDVAPGGIRSTVTVFGDRLEMIYCPQRPRAFWPQGGSIGRAADLFAQERKHLRAAIRQARPDVVHAHWLYEFAWAALQADVPCLVTAHDSPRVILRYMPNLYRLVRFVMAHWVARRATRLTAVSPYMASELRRLTRAPISVIPNPLPRDAEHPTHGAPDRSDGGNSRVVAILNGWEAHKNGAAALRALAEVRREHPSATLNVFGADCGPGEAAHRFASEHGLADGVIFRGRVEHAQLMQELPHFDVLLHPSLEESFGAAIAEAMALSVPVVAGARSGAVPWVVADAGVLVDVRDPSAMARALLQLLRDPLERRRLGDAGRRSVLERFSRAAVAAATEAVYLELLPQPTTRMVPA
jgi:glycosyltransferase involved in cell wall biosynthesis